MADPNLQANDSRTPVPKRKKTPGETAFNRTVYTGIGFGLNEGASLWITDQFVHGRNLFANVPGLKKAGAWFSEEGFDRASQATANLFKLTEKIGKDGKIILPKERAGNALLMVTLISGGTLLLFPMKWLEDNKIEGTRKANHLIDKVSGKRMTPEQTAARDAEVEKAIACSPRQSWSSMLWGRLIAVSSSIAIGTFLMGPERNKRLMDWSEKLLTGSLQEEGKRTALHRYARLASVETYSCAAAAIVLEVISKLHARHSFHPHDPEICARDVSTPAVVPATPAGSDKAADDCGCDGKNSHAAKIQSRRQQATSAAPAMQA